MLQAADGRLYGLTVGGGGISTTNPVENGTFWVMDAVLPKPSPSMVNRQPTGSKAGSTVLLRGSHVVGTSAVAFNGVNAGFQVLTANYIRAMVPGWGEQREDCGDQRRRHHQEPKGIHRAVA